MATIDKIRLHDLERLAAQPAPVRITMPASVAYDMGKLTEVVASLAERFGCKPCFSGASCLFMIEHDFVVDPVKGLQGVANSNPMPILGL